jgi:branched-chain amino acid transport system ATP-binding protein
MGLFGRNGAGKSTTLKTIAGVLHPCSGSIRLEGKSIELLPSHVIAARGLQLVPEEQRIFGGINGRREPQSRRTVRQKPTAAR